VLLGHISQVIAEGCKGRKLVGGKASVLMSVFVEESCYRAENFLALSSPDSCCHSCLL
jgi:hypothetical protein